MGQFYKAEKIDHVANPIYQPPIELMAKVLEAKDKIVDEGIAKTEQLNKALLDIQVLDADNPRAQEKMDKYKSKIAEISAKIQQNPLEYTRSTGDMTALTNELQNELTDGELGVLINQKKTYDTWKALQIDRIKETKGAVTQRDLDNIDAAYMKAYRDAGGANYQGKDKYNKLNLENVAEYVDIMDFASKLGEKVASDKTAGEVWTQGGYDYDQGGTEFRDPKKIRDVVAANIERNKTLQAYYDQQKRLGLMTPGQIEAEKQLAIDAAIRQWAYVKKGDIKRSENPASARRDSAAIELNTYAAKKAIDAQHEIDKENRAKIADLSALSQIVRLTPEQIRQRRLGFNEYAGEVVKYLRMDASKPVYPYQIRKNLRDKIAQAKIYGDKKGIEEFTAIYNEFENRRKESMKGTAESSWYSVASIPGIDLNKVIGYKKAADAVSAKPVQLANKQGQVVITYKESKNDNNKTKIYNKTKILSNTTVQAVYSNPAKYGLPADLFKGIDDTKLSIGDLYANTSSLVPLATSATDMSKNTMNIDIISDNFTIQQSIPFTNFGPEN